MQLKPARIMMMTFFFTLLWGQGAQASSRWDVIKWCSAATQDDAHRCEGFILAAIDLRTSDDFSSQKSCFMPNTSLVQVRHEVVVWLKDNKIASEQSGLALVSRALKERFPCPR